MRKAYVFGKPRMARMADIDGDPDAEDYLSMTVYETDHGLIDTGILDPQGNPIRYTLSIGPIGYVQYGEDD